MSFLEYPDYYDRLVRNEWRDVTHVESNYLTCDGRSVHVRTPMVRGMETVWSTAGRDAHLFDIKKIEQKDLKRGRK